MPLQDSTVTDLHFSMEIGIPLGLRGESACTRTHCDLAAGIQADDASGMVTFRLAQPNPDFLANLAVPNYMLLPVGTPAREITGPSFPVTGPYRVARFDPGRRTVLERNPRFRVWSAQAQPDGFADQISWLASGSSTRTVPPADIERDPTPKLVRALKLRQPDRVHISPTAAVHFMWLNTQVAPFNRRNARRALAYATDRPELMHLTANYWPAVQPTCQLLAPGLPGADPYCPFSLRPTARSAASPPDLDRARRLLSHSNTATAVTVRVPAEQPPLSIGRWYVDLLHRLGFRARLAVRPADTYYEELDQPAGWRDQIGWYGWIADTPFPSYMLPPLSSCRRELQPTLKELWPSQSHACNHRVAAAMTRAHDLEATDPATSSRLWARIDHALTRSATVIPLFSLPDTTVTSARVRDFQIHLSLGPLLAQTSLTCAAPGRYC